MAYSMDYRLRAVEYKDEGHTFKELRETFKIPAITYYDRKRKQESGYYEEEHKFERKGKIDKQALVKAVSEKPDSYLGELGKPFNRTEQAVFYALGKPGITLKKRAIPTAKSRKKNVRNI